MRRSFNGVAKEVLLEALEGLGLGKPEFKGLLDHELHQLKEDPYFSRAEDLLSAKFKGKNVKVEQDLGFLFY